MESENIIKMQEGTDLTNGNLFNNMIKFSIPLLITNLLSSMYNIVDGIWIGRLIGDAGVATTTNCWPIILVASSILTAVTVTTSVMVSQRYASKEKQEIKNVITPLYIISIILGVITSGILILSLDFWLDIFNTPTEILQMSREYLTIYLIGYVFQFFEMTIIESIRATGNSKTPLILLTIVMITNIVLDPIFILLGFGIGGAAIATAVSMILGLIIDLIYVKKKSELLCFNAKHINFNKAFISEASKIGFPMMIEELSTIFTIMVEVYVSNSLGVVGGSSYGIVSKLQQVIWIIGGTVCTLLTVVVGQFIGKRDFDNLSKVLINGLKLIFIPTTLIALFIIFGSTWFCTIFTNNSEVIQTAISYLSIVGIAFTLVPLCQLLYGFILGTGKTKYTFAYCALASIAEIVIVLYIYNQYNKPLEAMGLGILAWYIILIALCTIFYFSKKWKPNEEVNC